MLKGSAFPVESGKNKVTTGSFERIRGVRCYADGDLYITYLNDPSVVTESFVAGEDMELNNVDTLTIVSGTYSFSTK